MIVLKIRNLDGMVRVYIIVDKNKNYLRWGDLYLIDVNFSRRLRIYLEFF